MTNEAINSATTSAWRFSISSQTCGVGFSGCRGSLRKTIKSDGNKLNDLRLSKALASESNHGGDSD
jgi:hypothetical protein